MEKSSLVIVAVSFIVLIGGALVYSTVKDGDGGEEIALSDKVKGNPEATVVLAEYSDFQCPACRSFAPVVKDLVDTYGDQIRFEYHHFPLIAIHQSAELAARASEAAGAQGKFWEMHDLLFDRQTQWANNINPRNQFIAYAEELGLDVDTFTRHLGSNTVRDAVQEGMREGRTLQINATPTFFLNGERVDMEAIGGTFDAFRHHIEVAIGVTAPDETPAAAVTDVEFSF